MSTKSNKSVALLCSLILSSQLAFAARPGEGVREYSQTIQKAAADFAKLAKSAKGDVKKIQSDKNFDYMSKQFGLTASEQGVLAQAIAKGNSEVVTAMYASTAARQLFAQNHTQFKDVGDGVMSFTKTASLTGQGTARDPNLRLTAAERVEVSAALQKKLSYSIEMLQWSKKEIETHTAVMKKTGEIFTSQKVTAEEALLLAIMEVKGVDKDAALKIVKKLKECV